MPERFARSGARAKPEYFKEGSKLDWPKPKATRQSKKEVRACRSLQVRTDVPAPSHATLTAATPPGNYPCHRYHQPTIPGSCQEASHVRPCAEDYRQGGSQPPILLTPNPERILNDLYALLALSLSYRVPSMVSVSVRYGQASYCRCILPYPSTYSIAVAVAWSLFRPLLLETRRRSPEVYYPCTTCISAQHFFLPVPTPPRPFSLLRAL